MSQNVVQTPLIALVGRPNVGKSTLFNVMTKTRDSLVADKPGLTRDRNYGRANINGWHCRLVDTGGLLRDEEAQIDSAVDDQVLKAVDEAQVVVFLLDGREGLNAIDEKIAMMLRRVKKPVIVAVNKTDFADPNVLMADFYSLGFPVMLPIAAEHRKGLSHLNEAIIEALKSQGFDKKDAEKTEQDEGIMLAVVGRPNAGKSTLLNRLIGEERLVASPVAGTTRDAIFIPYTDRDGEQFTLIDTAGIRRKARVNDKIEKFSIVKALDAIERANVVVLVIDAFEGIAEQDAHLLGEIAKRGRALIIAINKCDTLDQEAREKMEIQLKRKLHFIDYAEIFFISALKGTHIRPLLPAVKRAYQGAMMEMSTNQLTEALAIAYRRHQPPLVSGRAIKLQYAHQGGKNPPHVIIHGSRTTNVPAPYTQYLSKFFRERFALHGTPVRISYRDKFNPYENKK